MLNQQSVSSDDIVCLHRGQNDAEVNE